jgi:phosphopantothenoylcysteine decarboxylase/phosphopantothenate--cysteine ligase
MQGKTIVVGVCGGIAAYKAVEVVSRLKQQGHDVHVVMSEAATQFVGPLTFAGVSGNKVLTQPFPDASHESGEALYPHLYPATQADLFLLLPATANMINRIAQGEGTEPVSLCALSLPATCRKVFCPAMNVEMWDQPVTQAGVAALTSRGWIQVGPESGMLACGMEGAGRMAEPATILAEVQRLLALANQLAGKRVLILSGPTREHLDPVRYLSNGSSGRMGQALAEAAADRGAEVVFVTGPVQPGQLPRRASIEIVPIISAADMLAAAQKQVADAHLTIFAAAVADYRPKVKHSEKVKKVSGDFALELEPTPDIAAALSAHKHGGQRMVGFALESGTGLDSAKDKRVRKHLDAIVLNHPEAMDAERGRYTWIAAGQQPQEWGELDKRTCAEKIFSAI